MKVLINTDIGEEATDFLRGKQLDVVPYDAREGKLNAAGVRDVLADCAGYIAGTERVDADVLSKADGLRVIVRLGSGLDNIDLDVCRQRGIKIVYTPDAPVDAVAELAVGLMISLARNIPVTDAAMHKGIWRRDKPQGTLLRGKTVGIVGVGRIGAQVARLLFPFRMVKLGHDVKPDKDVALLTGLEFVDKDEILARSDFLLLHLPLTPETRGWLGADELRKMKRTAYLVNTARGALIDEHALYMALGRDIIKGAALDVFADEPYEGGPLTELPNIVLTRHIGSHTAATREIMCRQAVEGCWTMLADIHLNDTRKNRWRLAR